VAFSCKIKWGSARVVLVTPRYAFKFARWDRGILGFQANLQESRAWTTSRAEDLCPVLWSAPFGFLIVMPSARPLAADERASFFDDYIAEAGSWSPRLHGDPKPENYGILDGRRVRLDYEGKRSSATHRCEASTAQ
jgi:hypothetical protein